MEKSVRKDEIVSRHHRYAGVWILLCLIATLLCAAGCGKEKEDTKKIPGLTYLSTDKNEDATQYEILRYEDGSGKNGYTCLNFSDGSRYLLIPEDGSVPEALQEKTKTQSGQDTEEMVVLQQPVNTIYLAASAVMAHFSTLDSMDHLKFTGTRQNDWYIEDAKKAMENGSLLFAGKYSEPDYETLVKYHTTLAIESTMILHTPDVKEKLQSVGIPVMTDLSSYEATPFGRAEWIKVYGALLGKEKEAADFYAAEKQKSEQMEENSGSDALSSGDRPTVAFFYLDSQGRAVVRKSDDYIPAMIEMAGGQYVFTNLQSKNPDSHSGTVTMSLEQFYQSAADADVLIYNAAIEEPLTGISDLTRKNDLFRKFKAVREKRVWCAESSMYQASDSTAEIIEGFHAAVTDGADTEFIRRLQ